MSEVQDSRAWWRSNGHFPTVALPSHSVGPIQVPPRQISATCPTCFCSVKSFVDIYTPLELSVLSYQLSVSIKITGSIQSQEPLLSD